MTEEEVTSAKKSKEKKTNFQTIRVEMKQSTLSRNKTGKTQNTLCESGGENRKSNAKTSNFKEDLKDNLQAGKYEQECIVCCKVFVNKHQLNLVLD